MASASSSSSFSCSNSAAAAPKKHDLFISFRGEDTRRTFTSHLEEALKRKKIETYIDHRLEKGDEIWSALVEAIQDSKLFVVIFSKDYASSAWCLNELLEIMECYKKGHSVIPVFYEIDPSHVRRQRGSYQEAFAKHGQDSKHSNEKLQKWKDALTEAANLSGFHSINYWKESQLVQDIIEKVLQRLNHVYRHELRGQYISDQNLANVKSLLRVESREVRIIGIWGMGGIGKTSLAAAVFQQFSSQYEGSCFLENVREESQRQGLNYLFSRLVSELLAEENLHIDSHRVVSRFVLDRLRRKKCFIVLDDVNSSKLFEKLIGRAYGGLGAGSRVIVTSRDKCVLSGQGVHEIYQVKAMNFQDSLHLFSSNAFNKTQPEEGYEELSNRALIYADGIPLALKVLGSFLHSQSKNQWDSALEKLKKIPNKEIQKVLELSYDDLDNDEKNIFLDIACFLKGYRINDATILLNANGFFAEAGIGDLINKALITIDSCNRIEMHDLIQEMGRGIVREQSGYNLGQQSRLWDSREAYDVLKNNRGTDAVEGICLDMTEISDLDLGSHSFRMMPKLRFLNFYNSSWREPVKRYNVYRPRDLQSLPDNLRYMRWDGYPCNSLPSNFCPEKLVILSLRGSTVEKLWNGVQNLPNLAKLDLEGSSRLKEIPDLSHAPNLTEVCLNRCGGLRHVHLSFSPQHKLDILDMNECKALKSLRVNASPASIWWLSAKGCPSLQQGWVMGGQCKHLNMGHTAISITALSCPLNECLLDLPEMFTDGVFLTDSPQLERDTLSTLHNAFRSPGFRYEGY